MYLERVEIHNIKMFSKFVWELPAGTKPQGWHVLLGDNGAGKTTVLRSISMAFLGPRNLEKLSFKVPFYKYIKEDETRGAIGVVMGYDTTGVYADTFIGKGSAKKNGMLGVSLIVDSIDGFWADVYSVIRFLPEQKTKRAPEQYIWGKAKGWFSASFGAYRRFTGGDKDYERHFAEKNKLSHHLTLFGEDVALTEIESWLRDLVNQIDDYEKYEDFSKKLIDFINQGELLPNDFKLEGINGNAWFSGPNIEEVDMNYLSDGYRSVLSLAFELIRLMVSSFDYDVIQRLDDGSVVVVPSGVVLIDEIDVHLHPTWQQRVGFWFTKHFPNIQFIVASHSPLVCQAAINGTIFRLPSSGTEMQPDFIVGEELARLLYGNVLDAYGTRVFGEIDRSPEGKMLVNKLAWLDSQALSRELTQEELTQRESIRWTLQTFSDEDANKKFQEMLLLLVDSLPKYSEGE
jgi:hypothetical protein